MARTRMPTSFGGSSLARQPAGIDPFLQLHREMNRFFEDAVRDLARPELAGGVGPVAPVMNVSETDREIRIEVELPGVGENDVSVEIVDNVLTIRGEKKVEREEGDQSYHVMERSYGAFARSIQLPFAVSPDQVQASFNNGVLTISIPKAAAREKVHRIPVQGSEAAGARAAARAGFDRAAAGDKPSEAAAPTGAEEQAASGQGAPA
jgi:HSP20 family protein